MTMNVAMALLGAMGATIAAIASALVFIISSSKNAGRREGKLDDALKKLDTIDVSLKDIPILKTQIGMHNTLIETIRSDIRQLKNVGPHAHVPRSPSSPSFDPHGE